MKHAAFKAIRRILFWGLVSYVALIAAVFFAQRSLMYFPPRDLSESRLSSLKDFQKMSVQTKDGLDITGYFIPPRDPDRWVFVAFHGNAAHPADLVYKFTDQIEQGHGVLLAEYRGYGGNPGKYTEQGLYEDGRAYINALKSNPSFAQSKMIIYGESIGTGIAVQMAMEYQSAALVLDVPFDSAFNLAASRYAFMPFLSVLMHDQYRSDEKIDKVNAPVLIMLAGRDYVVPAVFGQALFEKAAEPKQLHIFPEAGHTTIFNFGAAQVMDDFLKKNVK